MTRALALWKAEALGRSQPVPFLLPALPGRFALPDLISRRRRQAAMWRMLSLRAAPGPVIWGRAGLTYCSYKRSLSFNEFQQKDEPDCMACVVRGKPATRLNYRRSPMWFLKRKNNFKQFNHLHNLII
uniref:Uncharacterized protein n=1 Tax=Accipiter nisus TaxID=211598 RepID=A0A8B9N862_9AVES